MNRLWDQPGVPHREWRQLFVEDRGYGEVKCQMCGNEDIRYLHRMTHGEYPHQLDVGVVCASKMAGEYVRDTERHLRNRAGRRERWLERAWRRRVMRVAMMSAFRHAEFAADFFLSGSGLGSSSALQKSYASVDDERETLCRICR